MLTVLLSLRYGPPFFGFWTIRNDGSRAVKVPTVEYQYNRNWKFLIYVTQKDFTEDTKLRYLKYMGGQGIFSVKNTSCLYLLITLKAYENVVCLKTPVISKSVLGGLLGVVPKRIVYRPFVRLISVNSVTLTIRIWSRTRLQMVQSKIAVMKKQLCQKNQNSSRKTIYQDRAS